MRNSKELTRLKRPRSCNGCKAYYQSQWRFACELGYALTTTKIGRALNQDLLRHAPASGICPKPMTYLELFRAPMAEVRYES